MPKRAATQRTAKKAATKRTATKRRPATDAPALEKPAKATKKRTAKKATKKPATKRRRPDSAVERLAKAPRKRTAKATKKRTSKKPVKKTATADKPAKPTKVSKRSKPRPTKAAAAKTNRERAAERSRSQSALEREIGPIPPVADPERRAACEADLTLALKTYFGETFGLPWSPQHREVIATMETVYRDGGLFALGMPRGNGKTSIAIAAGGLAMLMGRRHYLAVIHATQAAASNMLELLKSELENNLLLLADFPEVCYPIYCLEATPNRARGQTSRGVRTSMQWGGKKRIVLPSIDGSAASGGIIQAIGITGNIRGMVFKTPDGKSRRPDAFVGDDLQTEATAANVDQVEKRESILNGAVRGLAGPGQSAAGVVTITVQRNGDLADRILNQKLNPHWQPKRFSLVERWPDNLDMWAKYAELREADLQAGRVKFPNATKFYAANMEAMNRGAVVPWKERHESHELSAVQHAFNLKLDNPTKFDAEYQNQPTESLSAEGLIAAPDSDAIVRRVGGYARGDVPTEATHLFAGVDVQQDALFYVVLAVTESMTGWVVDYGAWPDQGLGYWTLRNVKETISKRTSIVSLEASLYAALDILVGDLMGKTYRRDDGACKPIDSIVIDANWGQSTSTVYSYIRQTNRASVYPFHGKGVTARQTPFASRKRKPGERSGVAWYLPNVKGTKTPRHIIADTNIIKSTIAGRWFTPIGAAGAWQLFNGPTAAHRMFADQVSAEYPVETSGRGRDVVEWILRPGRDNHYLDCMVMATTAALMAGCAVPGTEAAGRVGPREQRKQASLVEAAQKARRNAGRL